MERIMNFNTAGVNKNFSNYNTQYPQVRLIDFSDNDITADLQLQAGSYCVYLSPLDQGKGTLLLTTSGQLMKRVNHCTPYQPMGQALIFHPDLIAGTSLGQCFSHLDFFIFSTEKSLHLFPLEYRLALDIFLNIKMELAYPLDMHSKRLIASNMELFLNYCERFFSRTFVTAGPNHRSVLQRFDQLLRSYFASENPYKLGIPSVAYCADKLNLSANYFGTLIKKETGKTAQEYIRYKLVEEATFRIVNTHKTINEIAYDFGFKYPQHFSRFFKMVVGQNPTEYRNANKS